MYRCSLSIRQKASGRAWNGHAVDGPVAKADIADKLYWIFNKEWPVTIAGDITRAIELKEVYRLLMAKQADITVDNIPSLMYRGLRIHKNRIIDEYVSRVLGVSYKRFREHGKDEFPLSIRRKVQEDASRLEFEGDLIVVPFIERTPLIFKIESGELEVCEQFAAIGSGGYIADGRLAAREHEETDTIQDALYNVFEAMELGKQAPGVGRFLLAVVYVGDDGKTVAEQPIGACWTALRKHFKEYGPKRIKKRLPPLKAGFLKKFA